MVGSSTRYQILESEEPEEDVPQEHPPAYEQILQEAECPSTSTTSPPCPEGYKVNESAHPIIPPTYDASVKLPTYDETQARKVYEAQNELLRIYFPGIDREVTVPNIDGVAIGDDCTFIFAFVLAFFFNWIGLCIGLCVLQMISSRYGALTGFGASLIKWLLIIRYSACCEDYTVDQQLLAWWIPMLIGVLFIVKGLLGWFETRKLLKLTDEERSNIRFKYFGFV